jgi:hypothetical protein
MLSPGCNVIAIESPFFNDDLTFAAGGVLSADRFDLHAHLPRSIAQADSFVHVAAASGGLQDDKVLFAHRCSIIHFVCEKHDKYPRKEKNPFKGVVKNGR